MKDDGDDNDGDDADDEKKIGDEHYNLAYDEEQRDIRRAFLDSTRDDDDKAGVDGDKKKTKGMKKKKSSRLDDEEEELELKGEGDRARVGADGGGRLDAGGFCGAVRGTEGGWRGFGRL